MKKNPPKDGVISENSAGVGTVTPQMVQARAAELAIIDGHLSHDATKSHFAQAKRELTGAPDADPKDAILESVPESERWDTLPGSTGNKARVAKARVAPSEDEDEEGRSDNERLVEGGIAEAEIEQSFQATKAAAKRDL